VKLRTIANQYYFSLLLLVFFIGSVVAYFILKSIINHEFNEKLLAEKNQLIYELHNYEDLQDNYYLNIGDIINLKKVATDPKIKPMMFDTVMYDPYEKKELPFRTLKFSDEFIGNYYIISITKSLLPNKDLIEGVSKIMLGLVIILIISLGTLNRIIFVKLWEPFYHIMAQLKYFDIVKPQIIKSPQHNIQEFKELENVLMNMISKNIDDFRNLKEYNENISHEIQTPLAIIKNKAEVLLQEPFNEYQLTEIKQIFEAAGRLSRLKEGLSTISKIENNQFVENDVVDLAQFISKKLSHFEELIHMKGLEVKKNFHFRTLLKMNNDLAYILFTNLLNNAIKHNIPNGWINIELTDNQLVIENTGNEPKVPTNKLFHRFSRNEGIRGSTGLGLALVKKITAYYGIDTQYQYHDKTHKIILDINPLASTDCLQN